MTVNGAKHRFKPYTSLTFMCEEDGRLKLCTCEGETLEDPDWVLERHNPGLPECLAIGRWTPNKLDGAQKHQVERVVAALQSGDCFDFPYRPEEGDVLTLRVEQRKLSFRREDERWSYDDECPFRTWRTQLVEHNRGVLESNLPLNHSNVPESPKRKWWQFWA